MNNPLNQPVKKWLPTILAGLAATLGINQEEVATFIAEHPKAALIASWLIYQIGQLLPSPVNGDPLAQYQPKPPKPPAPPASEPKGDAA